MTSRDTTADTITTPSQDVTEFLRLGLQPEALADLEPQQARLVISGLAKVLAAQVHPDIAGPNATILGLEAGDISRIEAGARALPDDQLAAGLKSLGADSLLRIARAERQTSEDTLAHVLSVNESLAQALLRGSESIANQVNVSLFMPNTEIAGDPGQQPPEEWYRKAEKEAVVVNIHQGVVESAFRVPAQKGLTSGLSVAAQEYLHALRPDLSSANVLTYIPPDNTYELEPGWYNLQTAVSKSDRTKRVAAYRRYSDQDSERLDLSQLVGTRVIGQYRGNQHSMTTELALDSDSRKQVAGLSRRSHDVALQSLTKVSDAELVYMLSRGVAVSLESAHDATAAHANLIFRKDAGSGHASVNYILTETIAAQAL